MSRGLGDVYKRQPYISKKNDEVQMIISHEITVQLGREMRKMSRTLSRTILEGLDIEHRK